MFDVNLELSTLPPLEPVRIKASESARGWDGIVGIRGFYNLSNRWFIPYRVDIGTGHADTTWQAIAGIGYQFDSFKLLATYRHIDWDFEDDAGLRDLQISGPLIGAIFTF